MSNKKYRKEKQVSIIDLIGRIPVSNKKGGPMKPKKGKGSYKRNPKHRK